MALLKSLPLPMGSNIIDFNLMGTDGQNYSPNTFVEKDILVIIFMCNHCPYVKGIINRLIALQSDYDDNSVQLIGINSNDADEYPEDSFENMQKWADEKGINFAYLCDETQEVAKAYQAQCTPDIYVFDKERKLAYHGRLDDNWHTPNNSTDSKGQSQEVSQDANVGEKVTKSELREALDALIEGSPVAEEQHPSMGCSIKWKN